MKMPYCSKCTIGEDSAPSHAITSRQRLARVIVGLGWLTLAWFVLRVTGSCDRVAGGGHCWMVRSLSYRCRLDWLSRLP